MTQSFTSGLYFDLHNDIYREADGLSQSELMRFERDPHYFQRSKKHKTVNMLFGSFVDSLLFDKADVVYDQYLIALTVDQYKKIKTCFTKNISFFEELNGIYTECKIPKKILEIDFDDFFVEERLITKNNKQENENNDIDDLMKNRDIISYKLFCQAIAMLEAIQNKIIYNGNDLIPVYNFIQTYTTQISLFANYITDSGLKQQLKGRVDLLKITDLDGNVLDISKENPLKNNPANKKLVRIVDFKTIHLNNENYIDEDELLSKIFLDENSDYTFQLFLYQKLLELNGFTEENGYEYIFATFIVHATAPYDVKMINVTEITKDIDDSNNTEYNLIQKKRLDYLIEKYQKYRNSPEQVNKDTNYVIKECHNKFFMQKISYKMQEIERKIDNDIDSSLF